MRILTFLHSFEPGGVERIALRLIRRWRALGVDAPLFLGRTDGPMAADVGADLHFTKPQLRRIGIAHWESLWMILTLPREIRATRPDLLFCAGNTYAVVAVALKLILGRNCPPIVAKVSNNLDRKDALWPLRMAYRLWLRAQGRAIDHFVGMEATMLDEIVEGMRVERRRVCVIPDPALSQSLIASLRSAPRSISCPAGGRRFVAVGRLARQKNVGLMLRAFARGSDPLDRLTLLGDGPERGALERLARNLGIADRVDFRGYVPEPASMLPQFDILLLSSDFEGVPAVVLEALAANLFIVATDSSRSMSPLLGHGALGTLVPVGDEAMFAAAIAAADTHQDPQVSLAQAERFTIERAALGYLSLMRSVLAGRSTACEPILTPGRRGV